MKRRDRDFSLREAEGQGKVVALSRDLSGATPSLPPQAQPSNTGSKDQCTDLLPHSSLRGCGAFEKCRDKIPEAMLIQ